jgi:hypothetical protein
MSSIFVNKTQFQCYKGVSKVTALKQYELYLDLANKDRRQELTVYDISRIDDVPLDVIKNFF